MGKALFDALPPVDQPIYQAIGFPLEKSPHIKRVHWRRAGEYPQASPSPLAESRGRQVMLAYIAALPLDESVIHAVLRGERQETDLKSDEMQTYERPGAYTLLANSAVSLPEYPDLLNRILLRLMDAWVDRYPERYVTRIYSQTVSESGDRMVQHFFMAPRYDLAPNAYMLDLARPSSSKIVRRFQERLLQKAPLPEELRQPYAIER